jgi:D-arabinose 1-dehydrogenase-like Zn-dependent alcohol dehydrogenase
MLERTMTHHMETVQVSVPNSRNPVPTPGPNDVLVKVAAANFCYTNYQVWEGTYDSPLPITPSHETVGTIVSQILTWYQPLGLLLP